MPNKFGIEIEFNSFDNRDFLLNPLSYGDLPQGINEFASIIRSLGQEVDVQNWQYNHNNSNWICKPDASCGIEVCSPVFFKDDFGSIFLVLDELQKDSRIKQDERCSLHVHVDVGDLVNGFNLASSDKLAAVLAWWIKCEHIFMDFACPSRKINRYCRCISLLDMFDHEEEVTPLRVVTKLSDKYLSLNTFHLVNRRRQTIEFRIAEGTTDSNFISNWIELISIFIDKSISNGLPSNYCWLDHVDFFNFLDIKDKVLKNWFLDRLISNCCSGKFGCFSGLFRHHALLEYSNLKRINIVEEEQCRILIPK